MMVTPIKCVAMNGDSEWQNLQSCKAFSWMLGKNGEPLRFGYRLLTHKPHSMWGFSVTKPVLPGNLSENQDQPSPISVLEPLFEEDDNISPVSCNVKPEKQVAKLVAQSIKSSLIDKS